MNLLGIVPARGGSVGVRRKNLRTIAGTPLVLVKLDQLRHAGIETVVCSTDDPVIASIARMHGYDVHHRTETAGPSATIADTVTEVVADIGWTGPVGVFQCTAPHLAAPRIAQIVGDWLANPMMRTAATVAAVHDVCWDSNGREYGTRVNRQDSDPVLWRETGAVRLVRDPSILPDMVDMTGHDLIELTGDEAADIDTHRQLAAAAQAAAPVVLIAACGPTVGSGHLHRALTLADALGHHDPAVQLVLDSPTTDPGPWAALVAGTGHRVLGDDQPSPAVVILDVLDTDPAVVWRLRQEGNRVVVMEDTGPGAALADVHIDELAAAGPGRYSGPDWAVLRPEFLTGRRAHLPTFEPPAAGPGRRVLVYGGGSDAGRRLADVTRAACNMTGSALTVFDPGGPVTLAEAMATHALLVCGRGRARLAAAHVGIPTISVALNSREAARPLIAAEHFTPRLELLAPDTLAELLASVWRADWWRREMSAHGQLTVDGGGVDRIVHVVDTLAKEITE